MKKTEKKRVKSLKPISLRPLKLDEALADVLQVKPEPKEKKEAKQKKNGKP